jgi:hypothetical protein
MLDDLYEFSENLTKKGIFFCFIGPVSQNILAEIGSALEQRMTLEHTDRATMLRVFSMIMEMAQNVMRYSVEKSNIILFPDISIGSIVVGYEHDTYFVLCGNVIYNTEVEKLKQKLEKLRNMTHHELREYYKEQIRKSPEEGSRGAGLGFIAMAKKASRPIEFSFRQLDEEISYFSLKTIIHREKSSWKT